MVPAAAPAEYHFARMSFSRIHKSEVRSQNGLSSIAILTSAFCLLTSLVLFLSFSLYQLNLPGFYYDEAFDLTPMLNLMHGEPAELLRGIGLPLGSTVYPVMRMDYMGSLNGYLTLPFMAGFGSGFTAARLEPIFFASVTILLAFVLAQRWFGWQVASLTALLLSVCPSFIWFSRQGITVTSIMTVFSLGSWVLLDVGRVRVRVRDDRQWTEDGRSKTENSLNVLRPPPSILRFWTFFLAGICLGLGLWAKINFAWWIALTAILCAVYVATHFRTVFPSPHFLITASPFLLPLVMVIVGFLIGAFPFIYFNLAGLAQGQTPATVGLLFKALGTNTEYGVSNANFLGNVNKRIQDFATFLNGSYFWFFTFTFGNVLAVPTFIASLITGTVLVLVGAGASPAQKPISIAHVGATSVLGPGQDRPLRRNIWWALLLCMAVYLPISAFTVSDLWATHFYPILPLPQMVMACAAVWLGQWIVGLFGRTETEAGEQKMERTNPSSVLRLPSIFSFLLALAFLAPTFSRDIWVNQQYHAQLGKTGGSGRFSDAIYKLAGHFDAEHVAEPIALDWGIAAQTRVLTGDRVRPLEIFGFSPEPTDAFRQQARQLLADPTRQYIVLWSGDGNHAGFAVYNRRQEFPRLANEMGRQVVETFIAHERSGLPVYVVLQAK